MENEKLNQECKKIWEDLGPWWGKNVEDGDIFQRVFLFPTIDRFLNLKGGESILDAGCGNGALSRYLANKGAEVFGVDFSSTLISQAKLRSPDIKYEQIDLTDRAKLKNLGEAQTFDNIVCSMVLHDMTTIIPFFESLGSLIKPKGSFVFSIPHPCFNSASISFEPTGCLTVKDYILKRTSKIRSKPGQPIDQLVFHRPIRDYFNLLIDQGMVMNGFEEPCVDPIKLPEKHLWAMRPQIPPALISRWVFS